MAEEEPGAVFDNWTSETGRHELIGAAILVRTEEPRAAVESARQERTRTGLKCRWSEREPELTVIVVAATSCHDVDHAARGAAKLGLEAGTLNLNILNELERDIVIGVQSAGAEVG